MKKYSHSYNYGSRVLNWRTGVLSLTILFCAVLGSHVDDDNVYIAEPDVFMKPVVVTPEPTVEDKIKEYFPRNWKTMIAIAHAESGVSMDAVGYNCYYSRPVYYDEDVKNIYGTVVHKKGTIKIPAKVYDTKVIGTESRACKPEDRSKAWSVDCFVLQKNYPGRKTCPEGVTLDMHLKEAAELSRVQGLSAWVTYKTGAHKKHLATNN